MIEITKEQLKEALLQEKRKRENEGWKFVFISKENIGKEEFDKKSRDFGYGVWWGAESTHELGEILDYKVKELKKGEYEIVADCEMHYLSGHMVAGKDGWRGPAPRTATITLKVDDKLNVKSFDFRWKGLGG